MDVMTTAALDEKQYIVVKLGKEQFGIDIRFVDNIVRMQRITRVPKVQQFFKGVINLRGEIVPVMSLRSKFELEEAEYTNATRIIILRQLFCPSFLDCQFFCLNRAIFRRISKLRI